MFSHSGRTPSSDREMDTDTNGQTQEHSIHCAGTASHGKNATIVCCWLTNWTHVHDEKQFDNAS